MEGRRDPEPRGRFRPDRVVVVLAVDAEHLIPDREAALLSRWSFPSTDGTLRFGMRAAEHTDLGPQLLGDEIEFVDRFFRRVHRDDRGRGPAWSAQILEIPGRHDAEGADHGAAGRVVDDARQAQSGGRVDDREIAADLVEPLVERDAASSPWRGFFEQVLPVRRVQNAGHRHKRRCRRSTPSASASRVTAIAARNPSAAAGDRPRPWCASARRTPGRIRPCRPVAIDDRVVELGT